MSTPGYVDDNPKTIYGDKKLPLHLAPMSAVHAMAEAFADGAKKYGPYNWREKTVSSTVYYAAALRHMAAWFDGEELAEDSGIPHLSHALACLAILIDAASIGKLNDNRPPKGASGKIQTAFVKAKELREGNTKPVTFKDFPYAGETPAKGAAQQYQDVAQLGSRIHTSWCAKDTDHPGYCGDGDGRKYPPSIEADVRRNNAEINQACDELVRSVSRSGSCGSGSTPAQCDQTRAPDRVCAASQPRPIDVRATYGVDRLV